jgi:hypothetical protein
VSFDSEEVRRRLASAWSASATPSDQETIREWLDMMGETTRRKMMTGTLGKHMVVEGLWDAWEGSPGWRPMLMGINQVLNEPPLTSVPFLHRGRKGMVDMVPFPDTLALTLVEPLIKTRPIWVGPEQLDVLPEFGEGRRPEVDAVGYGLGTRLPFDSIFLDFTDDAGRPALVDLRVHFGQDEEPAINVLYGALCWHPAEATRLALMPSGGLMIVPFGSAARRADGKFYSSPANLRGDRTMDNAAPLGLLAVGRKPGADWQVEGDAWAVGPAYPDGLPPEKLEQVMLSGQARFRVEDTDAWVMCGSAWPCRDLLRWSQTIGSETSYRARQRLIEYDDPGHQMSSGVWPIECRRIDSEPEHQWIETIPREAEKAYSESLVVARLAERVLRAIYLLEAHNVELVETPHISRQVRRQAQRKGTPISLAVTIRRTQRRPGRQAGGTGREFTHSFERMGGYWHVTRGPHVTDPEKLKPCAEWKTRHPWSQVCRREYHGPSFVDAGPGKPFVPKTRRL